MKKKIIFYSLVALVTTCTLIITYFFTRPKEAPIMATFSTLLEGQVDYKNLEDYVIAQDGPVYLFIYNSNDYDSDYVIKNVIEPLLQKHQLDKVDNLHFVNLYELEVSNDDTKRYLKNNFSITTYPSFIAVEITEEGKEIKDMLVWDSTSPYSSESLETWLTNNNLLEE